MTTISTHNGSKVAYDHNIRNRAVTDKEKHIDRDGYYAIWRDVQPETAYGILFDEAIEAYKNALRLNPKDDEARYNLELCKKQQKKQQDKKNQDKQDQKKDQNGKDEKKEKDKKDQKQDKQKQQQQQQKPQMSKENAEQLLNAAMQEEKNTQQRIKKAQQQHQQKRRLQKNW